MVQAPDIGPEAAGDSDGCGRGPAGSGDPETIVIVGGGFGGLYTALALAERPQHPPILLIEPNEQFLFLPLLYELLSGELRGWEVAPRYATLLAGRGIAHLRDHVERIDADGHRLHTRGGQTIPYRQLVLASGGHSTTFGVPGAERHCLGFRSLNDIERLQRLLTTLQRTRRPLQRLAVVGAGATGVELACKLADLGAGELVVELIEQGPQLLPLGRAFNREQAELALKRRDVRLRTHTAVVAVEADHLLLRRTDLPVAPGSAPVRDETLPTAGVIWTAGLGFRPPTIHPSPPLDGRGRLRCENSLQLRGQPDLFVVGDLACIEADGSPLPSTAQVAFQQAPVLAANLLRARAGDRLQPFQWTDLGEMLSLGRGEASLCGGGITLAGRTAFRLRQLAYLSRMPGLGHTLRVAVGWLADWRP
ncbi:MAG: NAD(P)/FAD-dependent oxidoreductase [Cyanobium sp.]